jgi:hypothetical protein
MKPQPSPWKLAPVTHISEYVTRTSELFGTTAAPVGHRAEYWPGLGLHKPPLPSGRYTFVGVGMKSAGGLVADQFRAEPGLGTSRSDVGI